MKTKKPTRRYETANEIREDIERCQAKIVRHQEAADAQEIKAEELFRAGADMREEAIYARQQAKRYRQSASRLRDNRMKHLKEKLAEWMTPPLPHSGITDRSISAK